MVSVAVTVAAALFNRNQRILDTALCTVNANNTVPDASLNV